MPESRGQYTILLIPEHGGRVKKLTLPASMVQGLRRWLWAFALLAVFLIFTFAFSCYELWSHRRARSELSQWRITMQQVRSEIGELEENLDRMASLDSKLRVLSDLRDPERQISMGALPDERAPSDSPFDEILPQLHLEDSETHPDELLVKVKRLRENSIKEEKSMVELTARLQDQKMLLAAAPAIWPVAGRLTSRFGMRISPITGQDKFHKGIDIGAPSGTTVHAPGDGTVVFVGSKSGYGQTLIINHGYGIITCYAHNSAVLVHNGDHVRRGQSVSKVGNTGASTGPHLHYEVRLHGVAKDPTFFILN